MFFGVVGLLLDICLFSHSSISCCDPIAGFARTSRAEAGRLVLNDAPLAGRVVEGAVEGGAGLWVPAEATRVEVMDSGGGAAFNTRMESC